MGAMYWETGWAIGLFEGEGCVSVTDNGDGRKYLRLTLAMVDRDIVERFQRAVGRTGRIITRRGEGKPLHVWTLCRSAQIEELLDRMYPHLSHRRQAIIDAHRATVAESRVRAG